MDRKELSFICAELETLVNDGGITWKPVNLEELPVSTHTYVDMMLVKPGYNFAVADVVLKGTYLFKIEHPVVKYLHHVPQLDLHMWAGEGFHEALDNTQIFEVMVLKHKYKHRNGHNQDPADIC